MQQAVKTCANFVRYLVCGAARQLFHLFLRPAFCGSQHGLTNVLLCLCGSSHCFCGCFNFCCLVRKGSHCCFVCFSPFLFCGASRCFFGFMSYIVFSWHHPSLRAVSSLSKPGALLQLLSPFFCSSERLAPRQCLNLAGPLLIAALFCPLLCLPFWAALGHPENPRVFFALFPLTLLSGLVSLGSVPSLLLMGFVGFCFVPWQGRPQKQQGLHLRPPFVPG